MAGGNFGGGNGSVRSPYLIEDYEDLWVAVNSDKPFHYRLRNTINVSPRPSWNPTNIFKGWLNGAGHSIVGLRSNLFREIDSGHQFIAVKDLKISSPSISGHVPTVSSNRYHGFLTSINKSRVSNVTITNASVNIKQDPSNVHVAFGSLVGQNTENGIIDNCHVEGSISSTNGVGGVCSNNSGVIMNSSFRGKISVPRGESTSPWGAGGIADASLDIDSKIQGCFVVADIDVSTGGRIGGITTDARGEITSCSYSGKIMSDGGRVGGIVGGVNNCSISDCYIGEGTTIVGTSRVGGIVGSFDLGTNSVKRCYVLGVITGTDYVGGIIGSGSSTACTDVYCGLTRIEFFGPRTGSASTRYGDISGSDPHGAYLGQGDGLTSADLVIVTPYGSTDYGESEYGEQN